MPTPLVFDVALEKRMRLNTAAVLADVTANDTVLLHDSATNNVLALKFSVLVDAIAAALVATPQAGAFTTLTANNTVTFSPASYNVTLSPSGTGVVAINPSGLGAIDNMNIGQTTPKLGKFTTLRATATIWTDRSSTSGNAIFNFSTSGAYDWQIYTDATASPALVFNVAGVGESARMTVNRSLLLGTVTDGMTAGGSLAVAKDLAHRGSKAGFYNTTPATKQSVTGSRGGNVALASLLTALGTYGIITDSSTA